MKSITLGLLLLLARLTHGTDVLQGVKNLEGRTYDYDSSGSDARIQAIPTEEVLASLSSALSASRTAPPLSSSSNAVTTSSTEVSISSEAVDTPLESLGLSGFQSTASVGLVSDAINPSPPSTSALMGKPCSIDDRATPDVTITATLSAVSRSTDLPSTTALLLLPQDGISPSEQSPDAEVTSSAFSSIASNYGLNSVSNSDQVPSSATSTRGLVFKHASQDDDSSASETSVDFQPASVYQTSNSVTPSGSAPLSSSAFSSVVQPIGSCIVSTQTTYTTLYITSDQASAATPGTALNTSTSSVFPGSISTTGNSSSSAPQLTSPFNSMLGTPNSTASATSNSARLSSTTSSPENGTSSPPATSRPTPELLSTTEPRNPPISTTTASQDNEAEQTPDPDRTSTPTGFGITTEGNFPSLPAPYPSSSMIPVFSPDTLGNAYGGGYGGVPESYVPSGALPSLSGVPIGYAMPTSSAASQPTSYASSSPGPAPAEGSAGFDRDLASILSPTSVLASTRVEGDPPSLSTGVAVQNSSLPAVTVATATTASDRGSAVESVTRKATESPPVFVGGGSVREVGMTSMMGLAIALALVLSV
ncbi:MAG: Arginase, catabolizes arginine to ornithine and urea [Watsoniomyces obsoletus]|nr:MAG: Arginase, catabolizes arginine to ornithine and urea [Watsoniomyces obsoletus]